MLPLKLTRDLEKANGIKIRMKCDMISECDQKIILHNLKHGAIMSSPLLNVLITEYSSSSAKSVVRYYTCNFIHD